MPMDKETLAARDALDACLDALVTVAASATPGPDGSMDDASWAALQHVLDLAEDPGALARELGGPLRENFTGVDAHGHHWVNGEQVKAPAEAPAEAPARGHAAAGGLPRLKRPSLFGGLRRSAALWSLRLSRPERQALEDYVDNSGKINDAVRAEPDLAKIPGKVGEQARAIAAALERAPDLRGLRVYRGQQWYKDEPEFLRLAGLAAATGGALRFAGFQSSTIDPEIAENFSSGTVLEITTATRGAYLEHNAGRKNEQYEVLLPHNSLFRVLDIGERDYPVGGPGGLTKRLKVVRMEQVPRPEEAAYSVADSALKGVGMATRVAANPPAGGGVRESLDVPLRGQDTAFGCGAASLQAALAWHGIDAAEDDLARDLGTDPVRGTHPDALLAAVSRAGLSPGPRQGMTLDDLAALTGEAGVPVLCCVQLHDGGHWVVVTGVEGGAVRFMDPATGGEETLPAADWEAVWHDRAADGVPYLRYGIAVGPGPG